MRGAPAVSALSQPLMRRKKRKECDVESRKQETACEKMRNALIKPNKAFTVTSFLLRKLEAESVGRALGRAGRLLRMADGLLEAVRGLWLVDPGLGPKPLLASLREDHGLERL